MKQAGAKDKRRRHARGVVVGVRERQERDLERGRREPHAAPQHLAVQLGVARSAAALTEVDGSLTWTGEVPADLPTSGDPLQMLRETLRVLATPRVEGLPPLTSGLVGMLGWDIVHRWETLPWAAEDDLHLPELALCLATDLAVLDHRDATVWLVANAVNSDGTDERVDEAYADAVARLDAMAADLARPTPSSPALAHLLSVHVCEPADGVAEVSTVFRRGGRARAVAFRLQGVDGRWRITALQVG